MRVLLPRVGAASPPLRAQPAGHSRLAAGDIYTAYIGIYGSGEHNAARQGWLLSGTNRAAGSEEIRGSRLWANLSADAETIVRTRRGLRVRALQIAGR